MSVAPNAKVAVGVLIPKPGSLDTSFLVLKRRTGPWAWELPGGKLIPGETLTKAAMREAKEETGLDVRIGSLLGLYSDFDRFDNEGTWIFLVFGANLFSLSDVLEPHVKLENTHTEYKWVSQSELLKLDRVAPRLIDLAKSNFGRTGVFDRDVSALQEGPMYG